MLSCTARPIAISISRTKSYLSDYAVWSVFWHHLHYGLLRATLSVFLFHGLFHKYNCWKYLSFLFAALFETQENLQISYMINNRSNGKRRSSRDFFALVQMDDSYFLSRWDFSLSFLHSWSGLMNTIDRPFNWCSLIFSTGFILYKLELFDRIAPRNRVAHPSFRRLLALPVFTIVLHTSVALRLVAKSPFNQCVTRTSNYMPARRIIAAYRKSKCFCLKSRCSSRPDKLFSVCKSLLSSSCSESYTPERRKSTGRQKD